MVTITTVNLLTLATSIPYAQQLYSIANNANSSIQFLSYNDTFTTNILGPNVSQELVTDQGYNAFHEAGIYNIATNSLYIASNWADNFSNPINVTILNLTDSTISTDRYANLHEANGGCAYYPPGTPANSSAGQQLLFCDEGDESNPSQLVLVDPSTGTSTVMLNNFLGHNFSSLNDIKQHPVTGDVWFTDTYYGFWQNFRPAPAVPSQVYRFEPATGALQMVADGFVAANGIEFSPDLKTVYVTDTGTQEFSANYSRPATIYQFDVSADKKKLLNRRVFAYADSGIPDGIHADTQGNVYAGCGSGDGVHVWNSEGILLGKFLAEGGVNNFAFVPGGMYIFNADKLYKVTLAAEGREVARDFGLET